MAPPNRDLNHPDERDRRGDSPSGRGDCAPTVPCGATISDNFFTMLGVQPVLGRDLSPEDGEVSAPPVTILSYALWQERFGGDPGVVQYWPVGGELLIRPATR